MATNEIELEVQLKEAGNELLNPPSSTDDLLNLLDKLECLLINVEQAPSRSMQDALLPSMRALISAALLRHSDADVKVSVTSCISEITRITAPDAPYNDDQMKEIFQLTVGAFAKLSPVSSRCYTKAISILDTVAKVRSCLVMLDLELDELIIEMFQHFLKFIRANHPHTVILAMEIIMTLVIDESEDISLDLLIPLLTSVRKQNQNLSPMAWKLGEKVMTNCAAKLKPYLREAVQSVGIALDEYAPIVASICQAESCTLDCDDGNGSGEHLVSEKLSPDAACLGEVFQPLDVIPKSTESNGAASTRNADTVMNYNSSKTLEPCSLTQNSRSTGAQNNAETEARLEMEPDSVPRKRGRKPNSLMNPEEGYDHSWICTGRKTAKRPLKRKPHDKGIADSAPEYPVPKMGPLLSTHLSVSKSVEFTQKTGLVLGTSLASPKRSLPGGSHPKRGRPKKKGLIMNQGADPSPLSLSKGEVSGDQVEEKAPESGDVSLRKRSKEKRNSEAKHPRKIALAAKTAEETSLAPGYVTSNKKAEILGEPEENTLLKSIKVEVRSIDEDSSPIKTDNKNRSLVNGASGEDVAEGSGDKKTKSSNKGGAYVEETPKTKLKRKRTPRKEVDSETPDLNEDLIGTRIKVWWPLDKRFYEGVVDSYDPTKRKHRILYADGDEETLNLKRQRWELVKDDILPDERRQETDILKPNVSSDTLKLFKGKATTESSKNQKTHSSLKRSRAPSVSKTKARRSAGKSADGAILDKPTIFDKSMDDISRLDSGSEDDDEKYIGKLKIKSTGTGTKSKQATLKTVNESPEGGNEFCVINYKHTTSGRVTSSDKGSPKGGDSTPEGEQF